MEKFSGSVTVGGATTWIPAKSSSRAVMSTSTDMPDQDGSVLVVLSCTVTVWFPSAIFSCMLVVSMNMPVLQLSMSKWLLRDIASCDELISNAVMLTVTGVPMLSTGALVSVSSMKLLRFSPSLILDPAGRLTVRL